MFNRIRSIIFMQITIAVLGWGGLLMLSPFSKGISEQISNLPEETYDNLTKQIAQYKSKRQLKEAGEQEVHDTLSMLHKSLGWTCIDTPEFYPRIGENGIIPVDMKWKCSGELLQLPIYLEGLRRLQAYGVLQSLHMNCAKEEMEFQLRFLRALPNPPDWGSSKEKLTSKEKALLRQGWLLMYWKEFQKVQRERGSTFDQDSFVIELSRVLTENRNTGARIDWSLEGGFTKRNF